MGPPRGISALKGGRSSAALCSGWASRSQEGALGRTRPCQHPDLRLSASGAVSSICCLSPHLWCCIMGLSSWRTESSILAPCTRSFNHVKVSGPCLGSKSPSGQEPLTAHRSFLPGSASLSPRSGVLTPLPPCPSPGSHHKGVELWCPPPPPPPPPPCSQRSSTGLVTQSHPGSIPAWLCGTCPEPAPRLDQHEPGGKLLSLQPGRWTLIEVAGNVMHACSP